MIIIFVGADKHVCLNLDTYKSSGRLLHNAIMCLQLQ